MPPSRERARQAGRDRTAATRVLAGARVHDAFVPALARRALAMRAAGIDVVFAQLGQLDSAAQLARVSGIL